MLKVFVALGKQLPKNKAIIADTQEVARLLAKYNCTMFQGGARVGLMGLVAEEFQKYSEEVVMIVPEAHKADLEGTKNKECHIVEGEADRLKMTTKCCDLMVVLPGGSGTLAEFAYYNETQKSGEHNAKIVVVNTNGYYNELFKFFKHQVKLGLLKQCDLDKMFTVVKNPKGLELVLQGLITEKQEELNKAKVKVEAKKECSAEKKECKKSAEKSKDKKVQKVELKEEFKAEPVEIVELVEKPKKVTKKAEVKKEEAKKTCKKTEVKKESKKPVEKSKAKKVEKVEVKEKVKAEPKKTEEKKEPKKVVKSKSTKKPEVNATASKAKTTKSTTKKTTKK